MQHPTKTDTLTPSAEQTLIEASAAPEPQSADLVAEERMKRGSRRFRTFAPAGTSGPAPPRGAAGSSQARVAGCEWAYRLGGQSDQVGPFGPWRRFYRASRCRSTRRESHGQPARPEGNAGAVTKRRPPQRGQDAQLFGTSILFGELPAIVL